MPFEALKLLNTMLDFYESTPLNERFNKYLVLLQGDSKDIVLPIARYNPMGKQIVNDTIKQLIDSDTETILLRIIHDINTSKKYPIQSTIKVGINICDDLGGAWSQIYNTDYNSKFQQASLIKRNFCTPLFYVSQPINPSIITNRIEEYLFRTLYHILHGQVFTLEDHVKQELFVAENTTSSLSTIVKPKSEYIEIENFYKEFAHETDHSIIFNFFYGDIASNSLNYKAHGINGVTGFEYVKYVLL